MKALLDMFLVFLPVCVTFGPLLLLLGVLLRTPAEGEGTIQNKKSKVFLFAGTVMITFALTAFYWKIFP